MKWIVLLAVVFGSLTGRAQSPQGGEFPSPFAFSFVDSAAATKDALYSRARAWFAQKYNSSKDVLQLEDKDNGKIIGKAAMPLPGKGGRGMILCTSTIRYTITIDVKEGRYRLTISDFYHEGCYSGSGNMPSGGSLDNVKSDAGTMYITRKDWANIKSAAADQCYRLFSSLKTTMHTDSGNDRW